jgi:PIN domain nuclease of toxin-antitoxin system
MTLIVDASVVLAVLLRESGSAEVQDMLDGAKISTVNLSEVYRKLIDGGLNMATITDSVGCLRLDVIEFDEVQALETARLRPATRSIGASFADRACLGLAILAGCPVLTADRKWSELKLPIEIRQIR